MPSQKTRLYVNRFKSERFRHNEATSARRIGARHRYRQARHDRARNRRATRRTLEAVRRPALCRREFDVAESEVQKALDLAPRSPEAAHAHGASLRGARPATRGLSRLQDSASGTTTATAPPCA